MFEGSLSTGNVEPLKSLKGIVKSLGVVFGDIGTSPIYTFSVIFFLIPPTLPNILGVLSLIAWTLILLVSVEYAWLAMSLGRKGEGGTIVLRELLVPMIKSRKQVAFITALSFVGIALFIGDGVITPAISVLSAIEGLSLITPAFEPYVVVIAVGVMVGLFAIQKHGTY